MTGRPSTCSSPATPTPPRACWDDVIAGFEEGEPRHQGQAQVAVVGQPRDGRRHQDPGRRGTRHLQRRPLRRLRRGRAAVPGRGVTSDETYADFQDRSSRTPQVDGTTYGLPLIASARALFVNNALLDAGGCRGADRRGTSCSSRRRRSRQLGGGVAGYGMPLGSEEAQAEAAVWLWGGGGTFGDADADHHRHPGEPRGRRAHQEDDRRGCDAGRRRCDRPQPADGHLRPGQDRHAGRPAADASARSRRATPTSSTRSTRSRPRTARRSRSASPTT